MRASSKWVVTKTLVLAELVCFCVCEMHHVNSGSDFLTNIRWAKLAKSIHLSWNKVVDFMSLYNSTSATVTSQQFYEEHFFKTWPETTSGESIRDSVNGVVLLCVFVCFLFHTDFAAKTTPRAPLGQLIELTYWIHVGQLNLILHSTQVLWGPF